MPGGRSPLLHRPLSLSNVRWSARLAERFNRTVVYYGGISLRHGSLRTQRIRGAREKIAGRKCVKVGYPETISGTPPLPVGMKHN
jgi:hypothetical protein